MRFEVTIYDDRDKESEEPGSHLGEFPTMEKANTHIIRYLHDFPQFVAHIYKVEIVRVS